MRKLTLARIVTLAALSLSWLARLRSCSKPRHPIPAVSSRVAARCNMTEFQVPNGSHGYEFDSRAEKLGSWSRQRRLGHALNNRKKWAALERLCQRYGIRLTGLPQATDRRRDWERVGEDPR